MFFSELFNRSNYETVCLTREKGKPRLHFKIKMNYNLEKNFSQKLFFHSDFRTEKARCNGYSINPRCVCAYDMYTQEIFDICYNTDPRRYGSLDHVKGKTLYAFNCLKWCNKEEDL